MRKKTDLYPSQQDELINKIITILDLDVDNSFTLYELDNDDIKKNRIMALIPDLRLYFTFGHIKGLFEPDKTVRPYLSIIKGVTKKLYTIERSDCWFAGRGTVRYVLIQKKLN